ncbi:phosphatidylserine decarboxylase 1 [Balamuthia mandrillaris]
MSGWGARLSWVHSRSVATKALVKNPTRTGCDPHLLLRHTSPWSTGIAALWVGGLRQGCSFSGRRWKVTLPSAQPSLTVSVAHHIKASPAFQVPPRTTCTSTAVFTAAKRFGREGSLFSSVSASVHTTKKKGRRALRAIGLTLGLGIGAFGIATALFLRQKEAATPKQMRVLQLLPTRILSSVWGWVNEVELPVWLRVRLFLLWSKVYDCKLDEMEYPLEYYKNLAEFFTRKLKDGVRPLGPDLVSPVDGRVLIFGKVHDDKVEQVKGLNYDLASFLGDTENLRSIQSYSPGSGNPAIDGSNTTNNTLYQCVIYLAPGDYHGIHAPIDFDIKERRHFPGHLFPVAPVMVNLVQGLFALNERVVLLGKWKHGFFSLTPVGATNVGSITLTLEPDFKSNQAKHKIGVGEDGQPYFKKYYTNQRLSKGEEIAFFRLGSTVVLLFECNPEMQWHIQPGQHVKLGQTLATVPHN